MSVRDKPKYTLSTVVEEPGVNIRKPEPRPDPQVAKELLARLGDSLPAGRKFEHMNRVYMTVRSGCIVCGRECVAPFGEPPLTERGQMLLCEECAERERKAGQKL